MALVALLMLQAAVAQGDPAAPRPIGLGQGITIDPCRPSQKGEVVVCGSKDGDERYRLRPLDHARYERSGRAETTLTGNVKGAAEVERAEIAPGQISNRFMLRLKIPF